MVAITKVDTFFFCSVYNQMEAHVHVLQRQSYVYVDIALALYKMEIIKKLPSFAFCES